MAKIANVLLFMLAQSAVGKEYEWAGIFETPENEYTWIAQKKNGAYADPAMKLVALPASSVTEAGLDALETSGDSAMALSCTNLSAGQTIKPEVNKCYRLVFDQGTSESRYTVDASAVSGIAFFAEHFPTEFENTDHYFKDTAGTDIEPQGQLPKGSGGGEHSHGHGGATGKEYEWAGIFETPEKNYLWTAQKVEGKYADPRMKLVALPASSVTAAGLDELESAGNAAMELSCTDLSAGQTIVPALNKCYRLVFDQDAWQSLYPVDASAVSGIAFFAEHFPIEFESTAHYLKDTNGEDIEPQGELPKTEEAPLPAGAAIGSTILVNLVTLVGVILMVPAISRAATQKHAIFHGALLSFAAGALLSCAFFLLLFEATHLVGVGWKTEVEVLWRWGTMILAGMIVPAFIETLATFAILAARKGKTAGPVENDAVDQSNTPAEKDSKEEARPVDFKVKARKAGAVIVGDFFHNLCDGFFTGAAFKGCGEAFGWGVAAATILHELPQELADFAVLTGPEVAMNKFVALGINFVSGLSVLLGAIIILYSDVSDADVGLLLAFGGGVYIHVGAVDCMPKMYNPKFSLLERLSCFGCFILGAVLIGLILIGHEHCVPGGDGHAHGH
eukprot:TRINITY_DN1175_c0_g1_i5.p1 TRINITY_DN1175_c0_g1~~TRINITY_DN1175_c0_g1_i5.p1  ORF type:complete len:619 (+),score=136.90 TRINITY_DN1175_c0_g1_i5:74-1930(+)